MKLHKPGLQRNIGRTVAPGLAKLIYNLGLTDPLRKIIAYLNYLIGRGSGTSLYIEAEVKSALVNIHRERPIVFDVGANVGHWAEAFREISRDGPLYLFEPQAACQRKINELKLADTKLICSAVGKEPAKLALYVSSDCDGTASLSERLDTYFQDSEYQAVEVDVIKLDDFINSEKIDFVDFIKFDIEGHEFNALLGLSETLSRKAIGAFSLEFGSGNLNSRTCFRDFWNLLSAQYDFSIITPGGDLKAVPDYYEDLEYYRGVSNYIAVLKQHPFAGN